ncbi:MAG TPA: class I tRNA ligase family protein, partial [Geminicoccaceae bacterium]|nr:class I tRNA ligase family protein [Geminicoccaceae bacterium]
MQGYRNFGTKLWNAARFCELQQCDLDPAFDPRSCRQTVNRWAIGKLAQAAERARASLEAYRFNDAAGVLYHFTWDEFCDWYVELAKPLLAGKDQAARAETRACAAWILAKLLHLLHPLAPFITEELWQRRYGAPGGPLIAASWPEPDPALVDAEAEAEVDWLIRAIGAVRVARSELGVPPAAKLRLAVHDAAPATALRLRRHRDALLRLARLSDLGTAEGSPPEGALQVIVDEATFALPLA